MYLAIKIPFPERIIDPNITYTKPKSNHSDLRSKEIARFEIVVSSMPDDYINAVKHKLSKHQNISFKDRTKQSFNGLLGAKAWIYVESDEPGTDLQTGEGPFSYPFTKLPSLIEVSAGSNVSLRIWKGNQPVNYAKIFATAGDTIHVLFYSRKTFK